MAFKAEFPFDGYTGYIRISNSGKDKGRRRIALYSQKKNPIRTGMAYARYLLCVKEKRILNKNEQADHKDGDKTNDDIDNLQILSCTGNNRKSINERGVNRMMVELKCPACKKNFIKEKNKTFLSRTGFYATCSRECNYKMLTINAGITKKQLKSIGKKQIIRLFRKKPYTNIK